MKRFLEISFIVVAIFSVCSCGKEQSEPSVSVTGVSLSPESIELEIGKQKALIASVLPTNATKKGISFTSSRESVATVSQDGIVEAISAGEAIVTVTTKDGGFKAHSTVTVVEQLVHVTGISLSKTSLSLKEGEEYTLVAEITPENAANKSVNWASDNEGVVTVSNEGVVKAIKAGKATVSATSVDKGKMATCTVEVAEGVCVVTGAATHISCMGAVLSGKVNIPGTTSTDLSFGILYSTSSGVLYGSATQIIAKTFDSDYNFSVNTEVLEPETTYFFRSYILQSGEIAYGELKSFSTLAVSSMIKTLDATDINLKDAVLNASLDLTDCRYDKLEYGFEVTPEEGTPYMVKVANYSDKKFSAKDETLSIDTEYSFVAYVTLDGRTYKGEPNIFSTASIQGSITAESSFVSCKSATIYGKLDIISKGTFTKSADLYYSTTKKTLDKLKSSGSKIALSLTSDGSYSVDLTSLISNTQYYFVVIAKVDDMEIQTEVKSFTTQKVQAQVSVTAEASDVYCNRATISGTLTITSPDSFTKSATVYYSRTAYTLDKLKSSGSNKALSLASDDSYRVDLSKLESDTQYYFVVIAKVDDVEIQTEVKSFTTQKIQASITAESSNVLYKRATISGTLTITSPGSFTKSATVYYSRTANTLEMMISSGKKKAFSLAGDGSYSVNINALLSDTQYYYCVVATVDGVEFATSIKTLMTLTTLPPGVVELGLSVLWHQCNIGASKPEDSGRYFAWGDVVGQTRNGSSWSGGGFPLEPEYPYYSDPYYKGNVKENLKPEYDAAHVILGGNWRMPTKAEFEELLKNCTSEWTTVNGVKGRRFTSIISGYTDRSIFLPAVGYGHITYLQSKGSRGSYWSSSYDYIEHQDGRGTSWDAIHFNIKQDDVYLDESYGRYGRTVRPVLE